jgi:hypothetical protein
MNQVLSVFFIFYDSVKRHSEDFTTDSIDFYYVHEWPKWFCISEEEEELW